jgi:hypothetical protein
MLKTSICLFLGYTGGVFFTKFDRSVLDGVEGIRENRVNHEIPLKKRQKSLGAERGLRACLKTTRRAVFGEEAVWQGSPQTRAVLVCSDSTKENTPGGSSTEEQRRQTACSQKTLRKAGLLPVAVKLCSPGDADTLAILS